MSRFLSQSQFSSDSDKNWKDDETDHSFSVDDDEYAELEGTLLERTRSDMYSLRLESEDCRQTDSFNQCLSRKELSERRTEEILAAETQESINIRSARKSYRTGYEVMARQESEINSAFYEANYYRAELFELCTNTTYSTLEKQLVRKYANAVFKELSCRKAYAKIVMAAALNDVKVKTPNAYEDWLYRIQNDSAVISDLRFIRANKEMNKEMHYKKKHEFNYNRGKSILESDTKAFKAAWPQSSTLLTELLLPQEFSRENSLASSTNNSNNNINANGSRQSVVVGQWKDCLKHI